MVSPCCRLGMASKKMYLLSVKGRLMLVTDNGSTSAFFVTFTDYTCYSVLICIWSIQCIRLGRFIEKSNNLITNELPLHDKI